MEGQFFLTIDLYISKQSSSLSKIRGAKAQVRTLQVNLSFIYQFNQKKYQGKKGRQYDKLY